MENIRKKAIQGFAWNSIGVIVNQGLSVIVHVILARALVPEDFGIIAMLSIFIQLSLRLQGNGLGESIIRKMKVSQEEYNFVFYYGLLIGLLCYILLFFAAPLIADFYSEPRLIWISRIISLNLILIPLSGINRKQLVKKIDFKTITTVQTIAISVSGTLAIIMAYNNCGVWSLVGQNICQYLVSMVLFLYVNRWLPTFSFDKKKSISLFNFGSKLMIANYLQIGFANIYSVIIGKQYSAGDLGFYAQGMKLQRIPSQSITAIIQKVSFPVFANIRDNKKKYHSAFRKTMKLLTFLNFPVLICLSVIADPLIPFVLSEKWIKTIPFFQMLVVIGLLEPIKSLFVNILKVEGKAGMLINYIIFTKFFYLVGILISFRISIYAIVISQILATFFELIVFSNIGKIIHYSQKEFLKDILPNLLLALVIGVTLRFFNSFNLFSTVYTLLLDCIIGISLLCLISNITKNPSFMEIKQEIFMFLKQRKNAKERI
jgi:O-antigen/teichoic acid export membrane protein